MLTFLVLVIGPLYAVGGVVRTLAGSYLDGKVVGDDRWRLHVAAMGAALTFAAGLSFLLRSRWAPLIAGCNALLQLLFLDRVPSTAGSESEGERARRAWATKAVITDVNLALFALLLDSEGFWRELIQPPVVELAILAAAAAVVPSLLGLASLRYARVTADSVGRDAQVLGFGAPLSGRIR